MIFNNMVVWAAPAAHLLGRYLTARSGGPLFLTRWRTRTAPARRDLYQPTGQAPPLLQNSRGGVPQAQRVDSAPVAPLLVDASGRSWSVHGDVAGQEPASGSSYPVRLCPTHCRAVRHPGPLTTDLAPFFCALCRIVQGRPSIGERFRVETSLGPQTVGVWQWGVEPDLS